MGDANTLIEVEPIEAARDNSVLIAELSSVATIFYQDASAPLAHALEREATHIYVERERSTGSVLGFFFARAPEHLTATLPLVAYMGLTATDVQLGSGSARRLWGRFLRDARIRVGPTESVLVWYRTGTPFGLYPCHRMLLNGEPTAEGTYTSRGAQVVAELRAASGFPRPTPGEHPFVVRGLAAARYSDFERRRIARQCGLGRGGFFAALELQESSGDRLLMFGELPI